MEVQTRRGWVTQPLQKSESVNLLIQKLKNNIFLVVSVLLCLFILAEVNYPQLAPQSELALFAMLGLIVVFLRYPIHSRFAENPVFQTLDAVLIGSVIACFGYVVMQTEPVFRGFWLDGKSLGDRAGCRTAPRLHRRWGRTCLSLRSDAPFYWRDTPATFSRVSALCYLWAVYAGCVVSTSWIFRSTYRQSDFFTQSRHIWHRASGDVHLCVPVCPVRHIARTDGSHQLLSWIWRDACSVRVRGHQRRSLY